MSATFPQTIQIALDSAIQLENEISVTHTERRNKKESLYTIQTEEGESKAFKPVLDKLNALASQLTTKMHNRDQEIQKALNNLESLAFLKNDPVKDKNLARPTIYQNKNRHPNRNGGQSNYQYRGTCFICKGIGHKYHDCDKATAAEKEHVNANYQTYYQAFKEQRNVSSKTTNPHLNSNGVSTRPQ